METPALSAPSLQTLFCHYLQSIPCLWWSLLKTTLTIMQLTQNMFGSRHHCTQIYIKCSYKYITTSFVREKTPVTDAVYVDISDEFAVFLLRPFSSLRPISFEPRRPPHKLSQSTIRYRLSCSAYDREEELQ